MMNFINMMMLLSEPTGGIRSSCSQNISSEWFEADPGAAGREDMAKNCGEDTHAMCHNQCRASSYLLSVNFL